MAPSACQTSVIHRREPRQGQPEPTHGGCFPLKGKRNLLQHFQACFLKYHFCKSPGPVTVFWGGGGDKYKKSCSYARNVRSWTGLGYYTEFNEEEIPLQGPAGPHCLQQAEPIHPLLAEGKKDITVRSQDLSTCGDVREPELNTHKLNCLTHSSFVPSLRGVRAILVPAERQEHSTRTWPCL